MTSPQPGDFAVCSVGGDLGKLIAVGEWLNGSGFSQYQHAYICVGYGIGSALVVVQAEPGGAVETTIPDAHAEGEVLWSTGKIPLTGPQRIAICKAARSYIGTGYSWLDYLALAAHRLHLPLPWLRSYIASSKTLICSQLVDAAYQAAGVQLFADGRWDGYVTPADLAGLLLG